MKKIFITGFITSLTFQVMAASPFELSVEELLKQYNYNKDVRIASDALVRCASLINMVNMIKAAPKNITLDPNEIFVGAIALRTDTAKKQSPAQTIEKFRDYSKQYQRWFKEAGDESENPFSSPELKREFEICDEAAREFLGK